MTSDLSATPLITPEAGVILSLPHLEVGYLDMTDTTGIAPLVKAMVALSPSSLELIDALTRQLAAREGINFDIAKTGLPKPIDGVPLWVAKMKQEGKSSGTIQVYMSSIRICLTQYPTPSRLDIQQWLAKRLETVSPARVSVDRKALRSLFSFLREEGLWSSDPTDKLKSVKVPKRSKNPPTLEEVCKLLEYDCHIEEQTQKFRVMTQLLATTGLRVSEAASLRKDCVLFSRHELRVVGKGDKEGTVPIIPAAEALLCDWLENHPSPNSLYVFPGSSASGYWDTSSYRRTLKRACKEFGLKNYHPHTLRHFFATYALVHGAKLEVVSKILRHASVSTTADIYRHVLNSELHDTVRDFGPRVEMPNVVSLPSNASLPNNVSIPNGASLPGPLALPVHREPPVEGGFRELLVPCQGTAEPD